MENKYEQFEKLLQDTEAAKKVLVPSVEETQKNLAKLGMDFSIDELNEIASGAFENADGELKEEELANVAGGAVDKNSECYKLGKKCGKALGYVLTIGLNFVTKVW